MSRRSRPEIESDGAPWQADRIQDLSIDMACTRERRTSL